MELEFDVLKEINFWIFSNNLPPKFTSKDESKWAGNLNKVSFLKYRQSRSLIREVLSKKFKINPLDVPLNAPPGKKPLLKDGWGHLSLSHCKTHTAISWAPSPIGIDIEYKKRKFEAKKLYKRFYLDSEKEALKEINENELQQEVLMYWVIKESALKWQLESVSKDFFNWKWEKFLNFAINKEKELKVKTYLVSFQSLYIGISYNKK